METLKHKVKWQVSLSNGETFFEGKGQFEEVDGEKSPWQRLEQYLLDEGAEITSLSLYTDDGRTFNLPTAGQNPKFNPHLPGKIEKPLDFLCFRYMEADVNREGSKMHKLFTVAEAIYPDYKVQQWVDENNPQNSWVRFVRNE